MTTLFETAKKINTTKSGSVDSILKSMVARAPGGVVQLAPGIALQMLEQLNFPDQRFLDSSRVYSHRHAIITGEWMEGHPVTLAMLPDGGIWIVDGQHRLAAISESESPIPVTIRIVRMDSEKEARFFYSGFDQRKSVRTNGQILDAVGISKESGLSRAMTSAVFDAAPILLNALEPLAGSANIKANPGLFLQSNKLAALSDWAGEARQYEQIIKLAKKGFGVKLRTPGVVAVALYTLRHQPTRAKEFWSGVSENDGLRKNDPRGTLISDLLTRTMSTGSIRQKVQQPAIAWNAWCEGRDLKVIKCLIESPITLWGTPLSSRGGK